MKIQDFEILFPEGNLIFFLLLENLVREFSVI
jgi:hypothetical protein